MAANQLVQTRIDGAIKEEAAAVLAAMGLTVSDAVRLLLTKVAQDKALPFELLIPNATTIEAMKEARKGKLPRFATVNDLMADLREAWFRGAVRAGIDSANAGELIAAEDAEAEAVAWRAETQSKLSGAGS